jgi:hypothetical protein
MARPLAYHSEHALNAICPYYTMFPLEYPFRVLKKHKEATPIVLDPFCGRGTTIYAAREMGLSSWGIDSSPIAVAIAKAKLATTSIDDVLLLAEIMLTVEPKHVPESSFFKSAYHSRTLSELCSLKEGLLNLNQESDASVILRAAALGCLHGPLNKTEGVSSYFSNQMPRTFASKPDYSIKYWKKKKLKAPNVSVIDVLKRKLARISKLEDESIGTPNQILCSDSRSSEVYARVPNNFSIVITSPPYYGMSTYIQDQWLRMWFLGGPEKVDYKVKDQLKHTSKDAFINSLSMVWKNISRSQADKLDLYVRFGSVPSNESDPKYLLRASLEEIGGWKIVSIRNASTSAVGKRQAMQMVNNSEAAVEYDFHAIRM